MSEHDHPSHGADHPVRVTEKRHDPMTATRDIGSQASPETEGRHGVLSKTGKRSSARKMDSTRHNLDSAPSTSPVAGAFGRRPVTPEEENSG